MTTQTPVAKDSPLMIAWEAYKATEDFANAVKWSLTGGRTFVEGSLWAAFCAGRKTADDIDPARTPNTALPPLVKTDERRRMLIQISVSADYQNRLDNQWEAEREIHADRWAWKWADDDEKEIKLRQFDAIREAILTFPMPHGSENALLNDLVEHVQTTLAKALVAPGTSGSSDPEGACSKPSGG